MTEEPLPEGWAWAQMGELAGLSLGKMLDKKKQTGAHPMPYLRNINVRWFSFDLRDVAQMDIEPGELERVTVRDGDLVVCEGGEPGRCAVWRSEPMAIQKALHRVRPLAGVQPQFLAYALSWWSGQHGFDGYITGSTIKHIPQERLRIVPIPLPPTNEQRRIVDELERRLSHVDAAERGLVRIRSLLEVARTSIEYGVLWSDAPETSRLGGFLVDGGLANGRSVKDRAGGFPVLRLTCLRGGRIDLRERKAGDWERRDAERFLVRKGDFFVSRGNGSLALVGRGGLVVDEPDEVAYPDTLIRVRVDQDRVDPRFLALAWNSRPIRSQIEGLARTTAGIYKVNQGHLSDIKIPVLPLAEQRRRVADAERRLSIVDASKRAVAAQLRHCSTLRRSLLATAFSGRLVPQDPDDESAIVLLERLRAEHMATRPVNPPRKKASRQAMTSKEPVA